MGAGQRGRGGNGEKSPMLCSVPDSDLFSWLSPAGDALWWNAGWVPAAKSWAGWVQTVEWICRTQLHVLTFMSWGRRTSLVIFTCFCSHQQRRLQLLLDTDTGKTIQSCLTSACPCPVGRCHVSGLPWSPERLSSLVSAFPLWCSAW